MGLYLFLLFVIFTALIGTIIFISMKNKKEDSYTNLETEEWNCPECGFHVQAGNRCIYCDTEKPS
ncbi:MAG: hypothetical protein IIB95_03320 [Candidatus Marinimicrobia bacterium]|nr:hypothetical protein [Candidatus Neomarinimicrobiota bacterium]